MGKHKPNLEAFRNRPDQTFVLNRFNYIESVLATIIEFYIDPPPERKNFMNSIVLNNSIVSFASKVKLFCHMNATEKWVSLKKDRLHRLMQIRNQFAHSGQQCIEANLSSENASSQTRVYLMLESISGNGRLEKVDSEVALDEFTQLSVEIRDDLHTVLDILKSNKDGNR